VAEEARAIELVAGDHLVHTGLHSLNILAGAGPPVATPPATHRGRAGVVAAPLDQE